MSVCAECGYESAKWFGRCPDCGSWSSATASPPGDERAEVVSLGAPGAEPECYPTGLSEVDRVLGGGLVRGSAVLLAGEPGIGKSTLALQLLDSIARRGRRPLLISGEESVPQIALRARRLGVALDAVRAAAVASLPAIESAIRAERPEVVVVDSVQTLTDPAFDQGGGSMVQVRECAARIVRLAKSTGIVVLLVGHVTKEGAVAGPKVLEHLVDVVVSLEGERSGGLRVLRASKNRFGACEETGMFTMDERGLETVPDPSALLLADRARSVPGSVVFPNLEGTRPMLVEIQALIAGGNSGPPRRVAIGLDGRRLSLLLAVLDRRAERSLHGHDVFVATSGGLVVREPAADLAVCVALASGHLDVPIDPGLVACGEVGLGGEIRRVPGIDRRLAEAARLGFSSALVPKGVKRPPASIDVVAVDTLAEAIARAVSVCAGTVPESIPPAGVLPLVNRRP